MYIPYNLAACLQWIALAIEFQVDVRDMVHVMMVVLQVKLSVSNESKWGCIVVDVIDLRMV